MDLIGGVVKETRAHPYTMIALVGLLLAVPAIYHNSASAADVVTLQAQLTQFQHDNKRDNLESRIAAHETEMFQIQQKISELLVSHKQPDQFFYDRLNKVTIERDQLKRELDALR